MQPTADYQKHTILYVDDEEMSLKGFKRAFSHTFSILTASSASEALELIQNEGDNIAILLSDQRMPGQSGVWLLEQSRKLQPRILRILVTAYADMEAAVDAVNTGAIYKYIHKPWNPPELETLLRRAIDFYILQRERDQLIKEKLDMLRNLTIADRLLSLGLLAAGLSHHIRNSLVSVNTFLELVPAKLQAENLNTQNLKDPDFWGPYLESVHGQIGHINGMLRDLWLASETPAFEFKDPVKLHNLVETTRQELQPQLEKKQISLINDIPQDLPEMLVDQKRFCRLFHLLIEDEIVSLPPQSTIQVRATADLQNTNQACMRIEITDNGPGLPEETLRILFDPFHVRSDSPSEFGIRLMACFFIVHQHGGKIIARSSQSQGTTFVLNIPLDPGKLSLAEENQLFLEKLIHNEKAFENHLST
ncbi:MAG: hypothetical protein RI897_1238 [Verrucomicrobiota bacterium]|jgi:two-component system probable response regulator PhcQ